MLNSYYLYKPDVVKDNVFAIPNYITDKQENVVVEFNDKYMLLNKLELSLSIIDKSKNSYFNNHYGTYTFNYYRFVDNIGIKEVFTSEIQFKMSKLFHYEWFNYLKDEFNRDYFAKVGITIMNERKSFTIQPQQKDIFNIFQTPFSLIKVVIIGADPYPSNHANRVAFDSDNTPKPVSYNLIEKSLQQDYNTDSTFNLKYTLKQGVFYLNSALTVRVGSPNSHCELWKSFILKVIEIFNEKAENPLPFILIGKSAQVLKPFINTILHYEILTEHPAFASREERDWNNNNCFKSANEILESNRLRPIIWI
jgi:uracil-DNA glycosylase